MPVNSKKFIVHLDSEEFSELVSSCVKNTIDSHQNTLKPIEFLRRDDLAKKFKCTPQTISDWVKHEGFPQPIKKIGKIPFWLLSEVEDFLLGGEK